MAGSLRPQALRCQAAQRKARASGATLDEILAATGWHKHTFRGFISTLASKYAFVVTSAHREGGKTLVYAVAQ
jgi:hypothetical protein